MYYDAVFATDEVVHDFLLKCNSHNQHMGNLKLCVLSKNNDKLESKLRIYMRHKIYNTKIDFSTDCLSSFKLFTENFNFETRHGIGIYYDVYAFHDEHTIIFNELAINVTNDVKECIDNFLNRYHEFLKYAAIMELV